jgi:hypothetical protein
MYSRLGRKPSFGGIWPTNEFLERSKVDRFERKLTFGGIAPTREFVERFK